MSVLPRFEGSGDRVALGLLAAYGTDEGRGNGDDTGGLVLSKVFHIYPFYVVMVGLGQHDGLLVGVDTIGEGHRYRVGRASVSGTCGRGRGEDL